MNRIMKDLLLRPGFTYIADIKNAATSVDVRSTDATLVDVCSSDATQRQRFVTVGSEQ